MRFRYHGIIDGQILRVFYRLADAKRWASLRPEAIIEPIRAMDVMAGCEPALF